MTFQQGQSGNPLGRSAAVFQDYAKRAAHLMEKYSPEELIALADNIQKLSEECSTFDALIIVNLANAFKHDGKERERLLDRLLGKAVQRVGGETVGQPIKIAASDTLDIENLTDETLTELIDIIQRAKHETHY